MNVSPAWAGLSPAGQILFLYFEYEWDRMAFPTTDVWIETGPFRLTAKSRHLDAPLEGRGNGAGHFTPQAHEFAGVSSVDGWDRAGTAQASPPGGFKQATFFTVAAAIIVAKEIFTFRTGRGLHLFFNSPQISRTFPFYTRVM
jgi:hypothetical protein